MSRGDLRERELSELGELTEVSFEDQGVRAEGELSFALKFTCDFEEGRDDELHEIELIWRFKTR